MREFRPDIKPKPCAHGLTPWTECAECLSSGGMAFSLKGDGWTRPDDYLPPMDEVDGRRRERIDKVKGKHKVETFGEY